MSWFRLHGAGAVHEKLKSLMSSSNAGVQDNQEVLIIAASVGDIKCFNDVLGRKPANDLMEEVEYTSLASITRQCEHGKGRVTTDSPQNVISNEANGLINNHHEDCRYYGDIASVGRQKAEVYLLKSRN